MEDYLDALASAAPTPGGGSAATIVGAMAAALVAMVARITATSPKFIDRASIATAIYEEGDVLRTRFLTARTEDEIAYGKVVIAMGLARATDAEKQYRTERLQVALADAARAPLNAAALALAVLALATRAKSLDNENLQSDVACARAFANAALDACAANVAINHRYLKDATVVREQSRALDTIRNAATDENRRLAANGKK